jgi:hypothetical protein
MNPLTQFKKIPILPLLIALSLATGLFSTSARAGSGSYSVNDVSGNYVFHAQGWNYGNGSVNYVPLSAVGLVTYTPATGTFHVDLILRAYGTNYDNVRDGTYTVNPDGHGTMTWLSGSGNVKHIDFYIVNGGAELKFINTDPPGTNEISTGGTMTKQ